MRTIPGRILPILAIFGALLAPAGPSAADEEAPLATGKVKLQFKTSRQVHSDQEIEVLRVNADGTAETVKDRNGDPLKGRPDDLESRTDRLGNRSARVNQDADDADRDIYTIRLPPGVYIIRVTDPTNPESDRSIQSPKFRVTGEKNIKIPLGVRLAPGSNGGEFDVPERFRVDAPTGSTPGAGTDGHAMGSFPDRPAFTFNVGLLAGAGIGGPEVKLTQDALSNPFRGEDDSAGGIFAADIYLLADLGRIADVPDLRGWTPVVTAGVFAGAEDVGGEDDIWHRLDLVNPIEPDTKIQIGGASGFWAPHVGFGLKSVDGPRDFYMPTQFILFGGVHQSNSEVDVAFEQPGGTTRFHEEEDGYDPMVGLRVGADVRFEMFGEEQELYLNFVYFHVFGSGESSTTKDDQFGNPVKLTVRDAARDFFMLGASMPFEIAY